MAHSLSIPGLVKSAEEFHQALHLEARQSHPDPHQLSAQLEKACSQIEKRLEKLGIRPGNLPSRTMNAAIWFLFLQQSNHLERHLALITDLQARFVQKMRLHHNPPLIQLFPSTYLFKLIPRPHTFTFLLHEGFLDAPDEIRQHLVSLAEKSRSKKRLVHQIKTYTKTAPYRQVVQRLNQFSQAVYYEPDAQGSHSHLKESFQRVNWAYFDGRQSLPHLQWSKRTTTRKLGHYNPIPDTIQVSNALDQRNVPETVLDYVMYHEMIHRHLGIAEINGRKSSHNSAFHQLEKEYAYLEQAKLFLGSKQYLLDEKGKRQ